MKKAFFFLLIALLMITLGMYRGEQKEIFIKAVNICLECIGVG